MSNTATSGYREGAESDRAARGSFYGAVTVGNGGSGDRLNTNKDDITNFNNLDKANNTNNTKSAINTANGANNNTNIRNTDHYTTSSDLNTRHTNNYLNNSNTVRDNSTFGNSTVREDSMSQYPDVEKDHAGGNAINGNTNGSNYKYDLHHDVHDEETALRRLRTAGSISITPELFEKIYLSPKNQVSNNIRSTFGNPTPLALVGFLLSLTPLSNVLMGWRGAGGLGAAEVGAYYFFGGLLMILGSFLEFILGNTFPFVVFGSFGSFWLTFAATLTPYYNAAIAYQPEEPNTAAANPTFSATFAYFQIYMGVLCFVYMIIAIRTNIIFVLIFAFLVPAFGCLAGVFFYAAQSIAAPNLQLSAGALTFVVCLLGWYLFFVQLLASVDFPLNLPVGDLSRFIKGASERAKAKGGE